MVRLSSSVKSGRERILDTDLFEKMSHSGIQILVEGGYAALNVDDVARHAGVPLRTALRLAATPSALLKAIIQRALDAFLSEVAVVVNGQDLRSTLQEILVVSARFVLDDNIIAINRMVISEQHRHPEVAEIFFAEGLERVPVTLAAWLSLQRDLGTIDMADCHTAARVLLGMVLSDIHRIALLGRGLPSATEITLRAELCAALFLDGCAVRP